MSNVTLHIGGRSFTVACAAGEEQHVAGLGRMIDAKLETMGDVSGQSEPRMLLFAALLLADEIDSLKNAAQEASSGVRLDETAVEALDRLAVRLENLASRLETGAASD